MALKFKLELDVVIDRDSETRAIEVARQHCARQGVTTLDRRGHPQPVPVEEFIEGTEQALLELLEHHPLLAEAGVGIERISCRSVGAGPESTVPDFQAHNDSTPQNSGFDSDEQIDEEELDEFESGLYLCRWPNGDFSVVKADSKREAVIGLDEWAGAEPAWLVPVETCMIDFRLNDRGEIELAGC